MHTFRPLMEITFSTRGCDPEFPEGECSPLWSQPVPRLAFNLKKMKLNTSCSSSSDIRTMLRESWYRLSLSYISGLFAPGLWL